MARPKNVEAYEGSKTRLLEAGLELFRANSYDATGLNEILRTSGVPKGSFYHYFTNKEAFGLAVAETYHQRQIEAARETLGDGTLPPLERLRAFFRSAREEHRQLGPAYGCVMCNLSTEIGAKNAAFQKALSRHWIELAGEIAACLDDDVLGAIGLSHLSANDAADYLLNGWSGALTRMKAEGDLRALDLFILASLGEQENHP